MLVLLLPPVVAAAALGLYFLTTFRLAAWRRVPWEWLAVMVAATSFAVARAVRAPGAPSIVAAAATWAIVVFSAWFLFSFTMYGAREDRPRVGERFPDFTLPGSDGTTFSLAAARGRRVLLIFYRGAW